MYVFFSTGFELTKALEKNLDSSMYVFFSTGFELTKALEKNLDQCMCSFPQDLN